MSVRACPSNKRRFGTKRRAKDAIKGFKRRTGRRLYPYRCYHCGDFHLTKRKPRDQYYRPPRHIDPLVARLCDALLGDVDAIPCP